MEKECVRLSMCDCTKGKRVQVEEGRVVLLLPLTFRFPAMTAIPNERNKYQSLHFVFQPPFYFTVSPA